MREEGVKRKKCNLSPIKPGLMESLHTGCHPVAVHIYTQTIHRTIQNKQYKENKQYIYIYIYKGKVHPATARGGPRGSG